MRIILLIALFLIFSGCAGKHVIPNENYSTTNDERIIRVAFDQDGNTYPLTIEIFDWANPKFDSFEPIFGSSYSLENWFSPKYSKDKQEKIYTKIINHINQSISDRDTVVVMIHGFNTKYSEAIEMYKLMKSNMDEDTLIIEVIWDGLYERNPGKINLTKFHFWNKALLYSNYAGNKGLRTILNGINKDVHLRYVTHSRGAAVAFSSLANPLYDDEFDISEPPFDNSHIMDVKMALFAPAIGTGHVTCDLEKRIYQNNVKVYLGTNKDDIATSKFAFSKVKGDTSLGGNLNYLNSEIYIMRENISFQRGEFSHGSRHALSAYFENKNLTSCFFWAIDLNKSKPKGCFLYR